MSSTTNHAKAEQVKALGFDEVIDTSLESLADGVLRVTGGYGADIVIDGIGGEVLSEGSEHSPLKEASQPWEIPQVVRQPLM
jgi:NADPH:quinone reductase-like Zn-dependent oxidoreductase